MVAVHDLYSGREKILFKPDIVRGNIKRLNFGIPNIFYGHKIQRLAWLSPFRHIDILASRRCGKDFVLTYIFRKRIMQDFLNPANWLNQIITKDTPRLKYWVVGADYSCIKVFKEYMTEQAYDWIDWDWTNSKAMWLHGGIQIEFRSAKNPDSLRSNKLNGAYLIELAFFGRDSFLEGISPMLANMGAWCLSSTTPDSGWYGDEFRGGLEDPHEESQIVGDVHFLYAQLNKEMQKYTGKLYSFAMAQKKILSKDVWDRSYRARLDAFRGQIYTEFQKQKHVIDFDFKEDNYFMVIGCQDCGTMGVLLVLGFRHDGGVDIIDEVFRQGMTVFNLSKTEEAEDWVGHARDLTLKYGIEKIHCDHDLTWISLYKSNGIPVKKAKKDVLDGIRLVQSVLKSELTHPETGEVRPFLRINPRCKRLIWELPKYKWMDREETDEEKPVKKDDHAVDALRYGLFSNRKEFKDIIEALESAIKNYKKS